MSNFSTRQKTSGTPRRGTEVPWKFTGGKGPSGIRKEGQLWEQVASELRLESRFRHEQIKKMVKSEKVILPGGEGTHAMPWG